MMRIGASAALTLSMSNVLSIGGGRFPSGTVYGADFADDVYTSGPPSISRSSPGSAYDLSGNYIIFPSNTLRRTDAGLTVEPIDINYVSNNATLGAAVGNPGALPNGWTGSLAASNLVQQVTAISMQRGVDCIDLRVSGTTNSASATVLYFGAIFNQGSAAPGQVHTLSSFGALAAGSFSGVASLDLVLRENDATPAFLRQTLTSILGLTGTLQRVSGTTTIGAATVGVATGLRLNYGIGAAIDFTIRLGWEHGSQSPRAFSPIRTTSGAAARAADAVTLPVAGIGRVVITYDDNSTQTFTGISTASLWTIPAESLNRNVIKRLVGYAS